MRSSALFVATFLACSVLVCVPGVASADTTVEAESMTWTPSGSASTYAESGASGGSVLGLWANATASKAVTLGATSQLIVRAKAMPCSGDPVMNVKVDGTTVATVTVSATNFTDYPTAVSVGAGSHTIAIEYTNDFNNSPTCDRNLVLDKVTAVTTDATCPVGQFRARYYNNTTSTGAPVVDRCEYAPGGYFTGSPTVGVNSNSFSVDNVALLNFPQTTNYVFSTYTGDAAVRVWLDGTLIIDKWTANYWGNDRVVQSVAAGLHTVQVRYYDSTGVAIQEFSASRTGLGTATTNGNFFAVDSFWNQPVPAGVVTDSRSAAWATALANHPNVSEIHVNDDAWTVPIYHAPPGTPTTQIYISNKNKNIQVPYSSSYKPSPDADAHLAIIDDATGCEYEFQSFNPTTKTAIAQATYRVNTGSGGHTSGPSHSGGELSYLGGLITPQDVNSGVIDHALRFAIPTNGPTYLYPGTRSDGTVANGVPEGIRIQLDPNLNLAPFALTPFQQMVAVALQTYGAFNADKAGSFVLYAQSKTDGSTYNQTISALPESLIQHLRFLLPTMSSPDIQLDTPADTGCAQQY